VAEVRDLATHAPLCPTSPTTTHAPLLQDRLHIPAEVKADLHLGSIPIVVLTTSQDPGDILASYTLQANAYVTKPLNLDNLTTVVAKISEFCTQIAALPTAG
jgi:CheY-like chemotaxis protein